MFFSRILPCLAITLLAGCVANPLKGDGSLFEGKAENTLSNGIALYDEGKYIYAVQTLQDSLNLGLSIDNQVKAHKYLAFTQCVSGKEKLCREEFRKALELDPSMELAPSEAGHPIWGPIFKSVKTKRIQTKK